MLPECPGAPDIPAQRRETEGGRRILRQRWGQTEEAEARRQGAEREEEEKWKEKEMGQRKGEERHTKRGERLVGLGDNPVSPSFICETNNYY